MDQNTPIILDKENIPPVAYGNDIARANAMVAPINANQTTNEYLLGKIFCIDSHIIYGV